MRCEAKNLRRLCSIMSALDQFLPKPLVFVPYDMDADIALRADYVKLVGKQYDYVFHTDKISLSNLTLHGMDTPLRNDRTLREYIEESNIFENIWPSGNRMDEGVWHLVIQKSRLRFGIEWIESNLTEIFDEAEAKSHASSLIDQSIPPFCTLPANFTENTTNHANMLRVNAR